MSLIFTYRSNSTSKKDKKDKKMTIRPIKPERMIEFTCITHVATVIDSNGIKKQRWDLYTGGEKQNKIILKSSGYSYYVSDGNTVAVTDDTKTITLWDITLDDILRWIADGNYESSPFEDTWLYNIYDPVFIHISKSHSISSDNAIYSDGYQAGVSAGKYAYICDCEYPVSCAICDSIPDENGISQEEIHAAYAYINCHGYPSVDDKL